MKKYSAILSIIIAFVALSATAQTTLQTEDFTTYLGTAGTIPVGWTFSYNGNYTTTASSGISGPNSYKFGVNNATISAPAFTNADTVSFWVKGNGTDSLSNLVLVESADNIVWDTVAKLYKLPTNLTGQSFKYALLNATHYVRFVYKKSIGNCAFDDFKLTRNAVGPPITAAFNAATVCFGTTTAFSDISVSDSGIVNSWSWNFGDGSPINNTANPTHLYLTSGTFPITLIVSDNLSHLDTVNGSVSVDSVVSTISSSIVGNVVTFTGFGSNGSGSYSYLLDVDDGGGFAITSPNYIYTYSIPGNYTACLITYDSQGCLDTSCTSFTILATGVNKIISSEVLIAPNPSNNGLFNIDFGNTNNQSSITIHNVIGKIVFTKEIDGNTKQHIDLSNQTNGVYFVTIKNDKESITKKIIINK